MNFAGCVEHVTLMNANYCSKPFSSLVRVRVLVVGMIRFGGCCQGKFTRGVGLVEKTPGNSADKLCHTRSVAYSVALVLLNTHQISLSALLAYRTLFHPRLTSPTVPIWCVWLVGDRARVFILLYAVIAPLGPPGCGWVTSVYETTVFTRNFAVQSYPDPQKPSLSTRDLRFLLMRILDNACHPSRAVAVTPTRVWITHNRSFCL